MHRKTYRSKQTQTVGLDEDMNSKISDLAWQDCLWWMKLTGVQVELREPRKFWNLALPNSFGAFMDKTFENFSQQFDHRNS